MSSAPTPSLARKVANAFVVVYSLDAVLSVADEIAAHLGQGHPLAQLRTPIAVFALIGAAAIYAAMAITPRLPRRILVLPALVLFWIALGALPVAAWAGHSSGTVVALIQLATAALTHMFIRARTGGHLLFTAESIRGPRFRLLSSVGFVAASAILLPVALVGYFALGVASFVEAETAGFVSFDRGGINLADRSYVRDDRTIRLVGMMHVGERSGYLELFESFARDNTIVLEEGVTDDDQLLADGFGYQGGAATLGLSVQPRIEEALDELDGAVDGADAPAREWPKVERADIDIREFEPTTITFLNEVGAIWSTSDVREQIRLLLAIAYSPDAATWDETIFVDLIDKRNEHLLSVMETSLADYKTVVVPWGGLHLPDIEVAIGEWGFEQVESRHRRLVSYSTILSAISNRLRGGPARQRSPE